MSIIADLLTAVLHDVYLCS